MLLTSETDKIFLGFMPEVLLHFDVNGGSLCAKSYSFDYIDFLSFLRNPLRLVWIVLGFLCLGLGTIGIVLPILPTVPFYMATLFCFAKSSEKLHNWCQSP